MIQSLLRSIEILEVLKERNRRWKKIRTVPENDPEPSTLH